MKKTALLLATAACFATSAANAVEISFDFAGIYTELGMAGQSFSGRVTYETQQFTGPNISAFFNGTRYIYSGPISFTNDVNVPPGDGYGMSVFDGHSGRQDEIQLAFDNFSLNFSGSDTTLTSTQVPSFEQLAAMSTKYISFGPATNGGGRGAFTMTKVSSVTSPVPEPATWAMMIVGFGAIGGTMRRKRKVNASVSFA